MAKRKSRKIVKKSRKDEKLDTVFNCPYCNMKDAIKVVLNRKENMGRLWCVFCGASYNCKINNLSVAVDVFSEWMDECYEVNRPSEETAPAKKSLPKPAKRTGRLRRPNEEEINDSLDREEEEENDEFDVDVDQLEEELTAEVSAEGKNRKRPRNEVIESSEQEINNEDEDV